MFKHLGPCPSGVSLSTGSLEQQYHPMAACFGIGWLLYLCEVSTVAIKPLFRGHLLLSCPIPCFPLVVGLKDRTSPCQVLPNALGGGGFLVGDVRANSGKLQPHLLLLGKAPSSLCLPAWSQGRGGQETGGSSTRSPAGSAPHRACHRWGSGVLGHSCLGGTCKHGDGVKTGHGTKAVCQLPCGEGRTPPFPLDFLSLQISVPAIDFLGHVILALSKSVIKC